MKSGGRTIVGGSYKSALSVSLCSLCCSDNIFKAHHVYDTCNRELIKSFALRDKPTLAGLENYFHRKSGNLFVCHNELKLTCIVEILLHSEYLYEFVANQAQTQRETDR